MTKIERSEHTEPGYDCMYGPCVAGFGKPGRPGVPLEQRLAKERASLCRFLEEK